jgi:hypothetical protein
MKPYIPLTGTTNGGEGDVSYVRTTPIPTTLGGATAGTTFSGTVQDALDIMLYPYQAPAFTSFSFSQTSPLEVGNIVAAGDKTFTWSTSNVGNIVPSSIDILDVTGGTTLVNDTANDGSEVITIGEIQKTSATSHTFRISGVNTKSATFTRDFSIAWQWRIFYGESTVATPDEELIEGLRISQLSSSISGTKSFLGGGYKYICYPTTFGLRNTFKDTATNLDVAMLAVQILSITNTFGITQDYYVHRTLNQLGGAINIAIS